LKSFFNEKVYQPAIKLKNHFDTELSKGKSSFSPDKIFDTYKKLSDDFDFLIKNFEKLSNEIEKRIEKIEEKKAEFLPEKEIEKKFKTKF
jgi:hypothetical protein